MRLVYIWFTGILIINRKYHKVFQALYFIFIFYDLFDSSPPAQHLSALLLSRHLHTPLCCKQTYTGGFELYCLNHKNKNKKSSELQFLFDCSWGFVLHTFAWHVWYERRNRTSAYEAYQTFSARTPADNGFLCPRADWVMTQHTHTLVLHSLTK